MSWCIEPLNGMHWIIPPHDSANLICYTMKFFFLCENVVFNLESNQSLTCAVVKITLFCLRNVFNALFFLIC